MDSLSFRTARAADIPAVVRLVNAAYRGLGSEVLSWTHEGALLIGPRVGAAELDLLIGLGDSRIELAFSARQRLLASVHLQREKDTCYLGMLAVEPECQGQGLGQLMLERCESLARDWQCATMRLTVIHLRLELLAYYERRGYRRSGREELFPYDDPGVGSALVPGMRLVELIKAIRYEGGTTGHRRSESS